jgi:hypothetical protein
LDFLVKIMPAARYVHITRDGRDVAASTVTKQADFFGKKLASYGDLTLLSALRRWVDWESMAIEFSGQHDVCNIRYEDLVHDPENTLRSVTGYLGVDLEPSMIHYHSVEHAYPAWEAGSADVKTRPAVDSHSVGHWQQLCHDGECIGWAEVAGELLRILGYVTDEELLIAKREEAAERERKEQEAKEREAKERENEEREAREREAREREAREREAREREAREREAREREAKEREAKEREAQERELKECEARERAAREREAKEREAKERQTREGEAKDRELQEWQAKERTAREREAKEREAKEREAEQREAKEREIKECEAREREAREREAKERAARERQARERQAIEREAQERESIMAERLRLQAKCTEELGAALQETLATADRDLRLMSDKLQQREQQLSSARHDITALHDHRDTLMANLRDCQHSSTQSALESAALKERMNHLKQRIHVLEETVRLSARTPLGRRVLRKFRLLLTRNA